MRCRHVAESYRIDGVGSITTSFSIKRAREWYGSDDVNVYEEDTPREASQQIEVSSQASSPSTKAAPKQQFFAVTGGTCMGVYSDMADVARAVTDGGGQFQVCSSEQRAWEIVECATADSAAASAAPTKFVVDQFVVWIGRRVGIMSASECLASTQGITAKHMMICCNHI